MVDRHVEVDIAFIRAKTKLAMTLAVGGIISLLIGLGVLLFGAASADEAVFELLGLEISASGIGGVIMATSAIWAFLAYQSRPIYSRHHQSSETMDENARLIQRNEWESTTQDLVRPPEPPPTSPKTFTERGE